MTRYLGPADTLEWPKDSGQLYTRGQPVPFSEDDIATLRGVGHSFENGGGEYMGEQIPLPRQPDQTEPRRAAPPEQQPTQAAAAGFTSQQEGSPEASALGAQVVQQVHEASIHGNQDAQTEPDLGGSQPGTAEVGDPVGTPDHPEQIDQEPAQQTVHQGLDAQGGDFVDQQTRVRNPEAAPDEEMPTAAEAAQPEGQGEQANPGGLDMLEPGESHLAGEQTREQAEANAEELRQQSPKAEAPTENVSTDDAGAGGEQSG